MITYLSCDARNTFFIDVVKKAIEEVNALISDSVSLVYPPLKVGPETGKVLYNVLQIQQAELVIFDVTPTDIEGVHLYNSGVMIEYGIVVDLEHPISGVSWGGTTPHPTYRVFCNNKFSRGSLTPIVNEEAVSNYTEDSTGAIILQKEISQLIRGKISEKARIKIIPSKLTSHQPENFQVEQ